MNADSLAAEVLGAAREVGADVEELDEDTAQAVRSQLIGRYSKHAGAARLWERLDGAAERQHQDSWRLIDRFLTDEPAIMLFEPTRERRGIRFAHGSQVVPVLAEATAFEFYLMDADASYVLALNNHDFLLADGAAKDWLLSLE